LSDFDGGDVATASTDRDDSALALLTALSQDDDALTYDTSALMSSTAVDAAATGARVASKVFSRR